MCIKCWRKCFPSYTAEVLSCFMYRASIGQAVYSVQGQGQASKHAIKFISFVIKNN